MHINPKEMRYCKFAVFETPFCVWEWDMPERNFEFLDGVDPRYFMHVGEVHGRELDGENRQHAAIALRVAYSQALETFFAFLAAAIQAPRFPLAWILRYQMKDLRNVVAAIDRQDLRYHALIDPLAWENLSQTINHFQLEGEANDAETKARFARLWRRFAADFLDEKATDEYNSLKHGLRARAGGFFLSFGVEPSPSVPAPREAMSAPQGSHFGTSYYTTEWLGSPKANFRARHASRNWDPENLREGLRLLAISTKNVIQFLKLAGGRATTEVQFESPDSAEEFEAPWKRNVVFTSSNSDLVLNEADIRVFSKEEILASLVKPTAPEAPAT